MLSKGYSKRWLGAQKLFGSTGQKRRGGANAAPMSLEELSRGVVCGFYIGTSVVVSVQTQSCRDTVTCLCTCVDFSISRV